MFYQLKFILRNLQRGGIYSAINIGGLAIGMAAAILILAWIHHEWSYDRFHTKEKQLYAVYNRATFDGALTCWDWTPMPLGATLKTDYPEIARVARMRNYQTFLLANKEIKSKVQTNFTDPDFLTMFDFPLLQGNRETALNDPYSVILTEKAASRLFGQEDPMGKTLLLDNQYPVTVTGVMKDLPGNTHFQFEALATMDFLKVLDWYVDQWTANNLQTYVELHPNAQPDLVNESIRGVINAHTDNSVATEPFLYPLGKLHLYSKFENGIPAGGLIDTLRLFGVIAGLILLIACINFMNLSTARSEKRAKEVGVRKVMGGRRQSLIGLFLGESIVVSFIAGAIALLLALMALPLFSTLMGQQIKLDLSNVRFWLAASGFMLFTGLLAGSYPAFYLSSFLPLKVLKGVFRKNRGAASSRKVLVVMQFTVACALIVSTLVIHRQIGYAQDRETGYDKDRLIYTLLEGDMTKNYELLKHDLLNAQVAVSVTKTSAPMTQGWSNTWDVRWQGKDPDARLIFDNYFADADWVKTVGATLIEGRDIDVYSYPTDSTALLLNESALKIMNLEHPVGENVEVFGSDWHVVGVVKDFILHSPYEPARPMLIGGPSGWINTMHIKLNGANRTADNLAKAEQIFKQYNPAYPFEYHFVDEEYARKFQNEQTMGSLTSWFAGLTIFISCLGLFALVAYMAETRRKEIGIRKVLGASVSGVVFLLSKEFLTLVLISVAVASPIAWWAMDKWLSGYAYRTDIPWWLFVVVGGISVGIALLTVGFQAILAATANPVKSIKTE
ncbi:MAG: ABC transporter permease [Tannerella sp.]|jgi:ABC-type antimicrobial peptide transport system permease subunit|nr:ABC transporter permease [Tannerella sp.]